MPVTDAHKSEADDDDEVKSETEAGEPTDTTVSHSTLQTVVWYTDIAL
jgi:hypothetical protein